MKDELHTADAASDVDGCTPAVPVNRLCNEIQLFDLCELVRCSWKSGNFCTNTDLLSRFDKIADVEVYRPDVYDADELDDFDDDDAFGDFDDDESGYDDDVYEDD